MLELVFSVLAAMTALMLVAWAVGLATRNGAWTDVFWSFGTGVALAAAALWPIQPGDPPQARQWLVAGLAAVWALRLGSFIGARVLSGHEDPRYARFREDWGKAYWWKMLGVALPQAPASALLVVSVLFAARRPEPGLDMRDLLGVAILLIALVGEAVADRQMRAFRADPANKGKVCERGLWGWSRHPNYFFEWLGWLAYPAIALNPADPPTWLTLTAPVVMFLLLTRISGIPPLEAAMLRSRGDAYRDYQARVSAFAPLPPKGRA